MTISGRIYLSPPDVNGQDRELLLRAVDSNWIAPVGPDLDAFEQEVAERCGRSFGVGTASGTAALHLGLLELGVQPGDEVIVPTLTFAATANVVAYCGATPVFVDVDPASWQVAPELVAEAINRRLAAGARISAVIAVDLYGQCADYDELLPLLDSAGIPLLEDAAEALGATYRERPAGSFGAAGVVSFNGNKIVTTSGGGMIVTDDERLADRCKHLASQAREPVAHYEHGEVGFNYRLSNLLAAFGRGQLRDLDRRVTHRQAVQRRYRDALEPIDGVEFMPLAPYGASNCWLSCITLDPERLGIDREHLRVALASVDIESRPAWKPLHLQPAFVGAPAFVNGASERIFDNGLCLPSGSNLGEQDQDRVIETILDTLHA